MKARYRRILKRSAWDALGLAAAVGMIYGIFELIEMRGWMLGMIMSIAAVFFGWMAYRMVYPLWFSNGSNAR